MENDNITITDVKVLRREKTYSDILVQGQDNGKSFAVVTTIREGRSDPDGYDAAERELDGSNGVIRCDTEWLVKLHEALDEQMPDIMEAEMDRICS